MRTTAPPAWQLLALMVSANAMASVPMTQLSTTRGDEVALADVLEGRPAVLVYEDRDSTALNQPLKDALAAACKEPSFKRGVAIVPIGNVAAYNWFPAKSFVLAQVKDTEKAYGAPMYLDWTGAFSKGPWSFKPKGSTVVVLDKTGSVAWSFSGKLAAGDVSGVVARLQALISPH